MLSRLILTTLILPLRVLGPVEASVIPRATCSNGVSVANPVCCQLFPVMESLQDVFGEDACAEFARQTLHLAYHDAMGFSRLGGKGGGADGSILTFSDIEGVYPNNKGLEQIVSMLQSVGRQHNISDGDLLHFAAAFAISTCPGAPQLDFLFGRPPATVPAPDGTIPSPSDSASTILQRFGDVGFSPRDVVSLLSAHSVAASYRADAGAERHPLDSTPGIFDTQIFIETLLVGKHFPENGSDPGEVLSPLAGEVRLQSDFAIARDPRTACFWQTLAGDQKGMQTEFRFVMLELQLVGQDLSSMVDCTEVIPVPPALPAEARPHFPAGKGAGDIEGACAVTTFPSLPTDPGPEGSISPMQCRGSGVFCWNGLGVTLSRTATSSASLTATSTVTGSTAKITSG